MAKSDFIFNVRNYGSISDQGTSVFHSSLTNPLTRDDVGTYCRTWYFTNQVNFGNGAYTGMFLYINKPSAVAIPDTKAISIRSWVRFGNRGGSFYEDTNTLIGVAVKGMFNFGSSAYNGYIFGIKYNGNYHCFGTDVSRPTGSPGTNDWHHLRLDVTPIKHNGVVIMDHLKAYTEINNEWVLVREQYREATDSGFISWNSSTQKYNGPIAFQRINGSSGYGSYTCHFSAWVDKVELFTETVEQPAPLLLSLANDTGPSDQDKITSDSTIAVDAQEIGATKQFSLDNSSWSTIMPTFSAGTNTLFAKQTSAEGRTSPTSNLQFTYIPDDSYLTLESATTASVVENSGESQVVYTAQASNPYSTILYSLKDVDDYLKFSINSSNGEITLFEDPNYEVSSSYSFTFKAQDLAGFTKEQQVTLSVQDVNETPSFSLSLSSGTQGSPLAEDAAIDSVIGTLSAVDPDGDDIVFSVVSQTVDGTFAVSGSSLVLTGTLDYAAVQQHSLTLRASDGQIDVDQSYTIYVSDVNEAPTFSVSFVSGSQANPLAEDSAVDTVLATMTATDPEGDAVTFSLVSQTVDGTFAVNGSSLVLTGALDYEANTTHAVTLRASDGLLSTEQVHTIYISNVNEAPSDISVSTLTIDDGLNAGSVVLTLSATDEDAGDTASFSLVAGSGDTDNSKFEVSGSSLKILEATDMQVSSSYNIRLAVADAGGLSTQEAFVLQVSSSN